MVTPSIARLAVFQLDNDLLILGMFSSSRSIALILGLGISFLSAVILLIAISIDLREAIVVFVITFVVAAGCAYGALEFFVFRGLSDIREVIEKLKNGELKPEEQEDEPFPAEIWRDIQDDIFSLAARKQEEIESLKKLETFRKEFIADVSHELKTPIFAAQGFLHTLLDGAVNDKTVRMKFLKKAARSLDGLDALVQDLLILSQIETGQIRMHFEEFDMYQLTEEVFEQFEDKLIKKRIGLRIANNNGPFMVYGDSQRLAQVMTNLVSNAIRHSFEDGEVLVTFEQTRKNIIVQVKDSGEGIPEEHQSRIFERFYRVDKSRTRDKGRGGTGLGLAIVKHILEGHNTRAEVQSAPGHGSVFSFKLPRFKQEPEN